MSRVTELVWRSNNRSVIRGLEGIARQSDKTGRQLKRDARESSSGLNEMGRSAGRLRGVIGGLGGAVGLGGLAFGIKSVVSAGETWQARQVQLQGALRNTGQLTKSNSEQLRKYAEGLATRGGFGTAENLQALTQFVTATGSASKAQRDLSLATDISRRSGKDFTTVVRAIMMLENGRTTGLARLGLAVPKVTAAQDALHASTRHATAEQLRQAKAEDALATKQHAVANLQQRFSGATSQFSRTTAGRVSNMQNAWKNLQEQLGAGLLPIINKLVFGLAAVVGWLNRHRIVLYAVLGATAAVAGILTTHALVTEILKAKTIALAAAQRLLGASSATAAAGEEAATGATIGFGAALDLIPIFAVIAGIVLLVTHFNLVKKAAVAAWQWIKTAASDTWNWIKGHWPLLLGIIAGPIGLAVGFAVTHFKQIKKIVMDVVHFIERIASRIFDALTWPFRKAAGFAKHALHGILHFGGSLLHTATFGLLSTGGVVRPRYFAGGGPVGRDTIPGWLAPDEGVVNTRGMGVLGEGGLSALNAGRSPFGGGHFTIQPGVTIVKLDARTLARAITEYTLQRAAHGPSSLVGGSLATGAAVTGVTPG